MSWRKGLVFLFVAGVVTVGTYDVVCVKAESAVLSTGVMEDNMPEYAAYAQPKEGMDISDTETSEACLLETLSDSEFHAMIQEKNVQFYGTNATIKPDKYEFNNSYEFAFPYDRTTKMSGDPFTEGYTAANFHEEGDEDWFKLSMTWGEEYDVVLKNLYGQDRHIYIWNRDYGHWDKWGNPDPKTGMPEKFLFSCKHNGEYYIQIVGGGPESSGFFFAAEPKGTINTALWPYEVFSIESNK